MGVQEMTYEILKSRDSQHLSATIEDMLRLGWKLQGGVVVATDSLGIPTYYQAVTKESAREVKG